MPHHTLVKVQNNLLRSGHGLNSNFFANFLIALCCLLWNYVLSNANASIILARNSSSPCPHPCNIVNVKSIVASTFGPFQQLVCITFLKSNETTYMQSFTKIWWAFCMCMFSCILCTSLHEEPPSLSMCASSHKKKWQQHWIWFCWAWWHGD